MLNALVSPNFAHAISGCDEIGANSVLVNLVSRFGRSGSNNTKEVGRRSQ